MTDRYLVYDLEIVNGIPPRDGKCEADITYCAGWDDHANMGISVICAYDSESDRYRVFCEDNFTAFLDLCGDVAGDEGRLVSFNGIRFDNQVIWHALKMHIEEDLCYDLLREVWAAAGFGSEFNWKTHAGFGLDACAKANFDLGKTGYGGDAPVWWQRGEIGKVIDYCLEDVRLTTKLFQRVLLQGQIADPRDPSKRLHLRHPFKKLAV